jgi:expansin (peptidoglycan-binding protein)
MRTRPLTLFGSCLLVSTAALAVACVGGSSDDADASGGSAGLAGSAGTAGSAGAGNASGAGGATGASGTGGSSGAAGGSAGAGNTGNVAGIGGAGGSGNNSGTGGVGNAGGDAGTGNTGNTGNTGGFGNESGNGGSGNAAGNGGAGNAAGAAGSAGAAGQPDPGPILEPGQCDGDLGGAQNGSVTFYTFSMGTELVNCSYGTHQGSPDRVDFVSTGDGQYFAAINTADYNTAATCGACIEVTRDGNRKVVVTVVDQCPIATNNKCKSGHLDLSRAAFQQIGSENEGYLGTGNGGMYGQISWKYVPCENDGNVHFRLKEPSNRSWNQVLVQNHKYQITKVEVRVNGNWVNAARQDYNFWEPPNGTFGAPPYRIRVTDVNGTVLEDTIELTGGDQEAANQMTCQ